MAIKQQLEKIKDNWLLLVIALIVIGFFMFGGGFGSKFSAVTEMGMSKSSMDYAMVESAEYRGGGYMPLVSQDFAPDVEERKITKTTSMSAEVERGAFESAETRLKSIVKSSDSFILNENVNRNGQGRKSYLSGYYSIKVDTDKYDAVISQLKEIGEVQSFSENARDITGSYTNTELEIEVEKERLERYWQMYEEAEIIEDKINLNDRIFNQERTIKYLEDSLRNMDQRVEYSTISLSIHEKRSNYANVAFVKLSELIKSFVSSLNSLLYLLFFIVPYAVALGIIWFAVRWFRRR